VAITLGTIDRSHNGLTRQASALFRAAKWLEFNRATENAGDEERVNTICVARLLPTPENS
jgi:hypothetical protein